MVPSASTQSGLEIIYIPAVNKIGDIPRDSVRIGGCIEIDVLKSLRSNTTSLGIVGRVEWLEVDIVRTRGVELDSDVRRKVEIGV